MTSNLDLTEQVKFMEHGWKPKDLVPSSYNKLKAPAGFNETSTCNIRITLNITQITGVQEDDESYQMRCILTQSWFDERLVFPDHESNPRIFLTPGIVDNLWIPNTFIANSVSAVKVAKASVVTWEMQRNKQISEHSHMFLQLICRFDLIFFPHDTQVCEIIIQSQTNTKQSVNYFWAEFHAQNLESARFTFDPMIPEYCNNSLGNEFSCLKASFALRRRLGYYVISIYGPSVLMVFITFIGFWLPIDKLAARTGINVASLLALVTQQSQIHSQISVSYVVALHLWFTVCTFFVFMAMIELAVTLIHAQNIADSKDRIAQLEIELVEEQHLAKSKIKKRFYAKRRSTFHSVGDKKDTSRGMRILLNHVYGQIDWSKSPRYRNKIDYVARILFPVAFFVFAISYFFYLSY